MNHVWGTSLAQFAVVDRTKAPPLPTKRSATLQKQMSQYETYVRAPRKGQAGRLVPTEAETLHAISLRVGRAAARLGVTAETWVADGAVYFIVR